MARHRKGECWTALEDGLGWNQVGTGWDGWRHQWKEQKREGLLLEASNYEALICIDLKKDLAHV